jgi:hypothetical protein
MADDINKFMRDFNRYTGDGLPNEPVNAPLPIGSPKSGPYVPTKPELRAWAEAIQLETEAGSLLNVKITAEESARISADAAIALTVSNEAAARIAGDGNLQTQIANLAAGDIRIVGPAFDASTGAFPTSAQYGGVTRAVQAGDTFRVSVSGTISGQGFVKTDTLTAIKNAPSASVYAGNWQIGKQSEILNAADVRPFLTEAATLAATDVVTDQRAQPAGGGQWVVKPLGFLPTSPTVKNGTAFQFVSTSLTQDCTFAEDTRTIAFLRSVHGSSGTITLEYGPHKYPLNLAQTGDFDVTTSGGIKLSVKAGLLGINTDAFNVPKTGAADASTLLSVIYNKYNEVYTPAGIYRMDNQVAVTSILTLTCDDTSEYNDLGTVFIANFNDATKSSIKVGSVGVGNFTFTLRGKPKFKATTGTAAHSGLRVHTFTAYVGGFTGHSSINGLFVSDSYIGSVANVSGSGNDFVVRIAGNTSLDFLNMNIGSVQGVNAALQVAITGGHLTFDKLYLEAQSTYNMSIIGITRSSIAIRNVYEENSTNYGILISASQNITIDGYRSNTNKKAIVIQNASSNVRIANLMGADRFGENEFVDIDGTCDGIYVEGVLFDPNSSDGITNRKYNLIRGVVDGRPAPQCVSNPQLLPSANGSVSIVGGSAIITDVPSDSRMVMSKTSTRATSTLPIKIPITRWKQNSFVVIHCIYRCTDAPNNSVEVAIYKFGSTKIKAFQAFHRAASGFQSVYIVGRLPADTLGQYSSLELRPASGVTADVHYLGMSLYDGGALPFGAIDESVTFVSDAVALNTASTVAFFNKFSVPNYRFAGYELQYMSNTGAGATGTVALVALNSTGAASGELCNFTTDASAFRGQLATNLAPTGPYPFRDHWIPNVANGLGVQVNTPSAHAGTARVIVKAVPVQASAL